jgi:hypothetical protein
VEWKLYTDRVRIAAMLDLNKPDSRKVIGMSFSHSQLLNADQPPEKVAFLRIIALGAMISGLLSFVLPFIFDIDLLGILPCSVPGLISIVLGFLTLFLERNDRTTRRLAVIGLLTWFALFIVGLVTLLSIYSKGSAIFLSPW